MTKEFDQLMLHSMPTFIAVEYQSLIQATSSEKKTHHALRVYELAVRELATVATTQYLIQDVEQVNDPALNKLLTEKLPYATLDTWQNLLIVFFRAYEGKRHLFFMPELYDFYWDSSFYPPRPNLNIEPLFNRMTQIYNDLNYDEKLETPTQADWNELAEETISLLQTIASKLSFFTYYDLIRIVRKDGDRYWYDKYTGINVQSLKEPFETNIPLTINWFYLSKYNREFLNLHPMLILWDEPLLDDSVLPLVSVNTAIYERFTRDTLYYLLTDLWQRVANEKSVIDFVRMLYYTIDQVKEEKIKAERLNWWQLQEIASSISQRRMAGTLNKYRSDLYLQRNETKAAFEDFLASEKSCFVLTGKSGVGKSNFLLALTEDLRERQSDICLLLYNGAKLDPDNPLTNTISQEFSNHILLTNRDSHTITDIWQEIAHVENIETRTVLLCIDAINENSEAKELLKQIDGFIESSPWPWLKFVITSRPQAWRTMKRGVRLAEALYYRERGEEDKLGVEMEPFSYSQELTSFTRDELPIVFKKYHTAFSLKSDYDSLPSEIKIALQDPLVLRLVADIYQNQALPASIKAEDIYQAYINNLLKADRLVETDIRFLEQEIVARMIGEKYFSNTLSSHQINKAKTVDGSDLFYLIHHDGLLSSGRQVNQSYTNLLDTEILTRLGEGEDYEIAFKFERFYDHYAGKRLFDIMHQAPDIDKSYTSLMEQLQDHPYLWGGIKNALLEELNQGNSLLILRLCQTDIQAVKEMMVTVLTEYGIENPDKVEQLLHLLIELGEKSLSLRQRILFWQSVEPPRSVLNSQKVAVEVAGHLGNIDILTLGGIDRSATIRTHTVQEIIYLWRYDRDRQHKPIIENRGFRTLEKISAYVKPRYLPNVNAVEAGAGVMLPIFAESYREINTGKEDVLQEELQKLARKGLNDLLFIEKDGISSSVLRNRIRDFTMSNLITFATRWVDDSPEHVTTNSANVVTFMNLPHQDREFLNLFLPYFNPKNNEINLLTSKDILDRFLSLNDTIITFTFWFVLLVQWDNDSNAVMEIAEYLFKTGLKEEGSTYASSMPITLLATLLRQGRANSYVQEKYLAWFTENYYITRGRSVFSGATYYRSLFDSYFDATEHQEGFVNTLLPRQQLKHAIEENNIPFIESAIHTLGMLAFESKYLRAALDLIQILISSNIPQIEEDINNLLAKYRQYYPYDIDDLLLENGYKEIQLRKIKNREIIEKIGGDFLFLPIYRFLSDSVVYSPKMQKAIPSIVGSAINNNNMNYFLHMLIETILNLVYGEEIFRLQKHKK